MKHSHHHKKFRSAGLQLKRASSESTHRPARDASSAAGIYDDQQPEAEVPQPLGNGQGRGTLSDLQQLELQHAAERNKNILNPIQSIWPTPAA